MSQHVENYCDLCGQLLYHSIHSTSIKKGQERWWWHGDISRNSEVEICGDCDDIIEYLVTERKDLVAKIRKNLYGKSPHDQMKNKPRPLSKQWVISKLKSVSGSKTTVKEQE